MLLWLYDSGDQMSDYGFAADSRRLTYRARGRWRVVSKRIARWERGGHKPRTSIDFALTREARATIPFGQVSSSGDDIRYSATENVAGHCPFRTAHSKSFERGCNLTEYVAAERSWPYSCCYHSATGSTLWLETHPSCSGPVDHEGIDGYCYNDNINRLQFNQIHHYLNPLILSSQLYPISILPVISKLLEKVVVQHNLLPENNLYLDGYGKNVARKKLDRYVPVVGRKKGKCSQLLIPHFFPLKFFTRFNVENDLSAVYVINWGSGLLGPPRWLRPWVTALFNVADELCCAKDKSLESIVAALNYSQALDLMNCELFLSKLRFINSKTYYWNCSLHIFSIELKYKRMMEHYRSSLDVWESLG
ncbi:hypothetical protein J6590_070010 [Homalodisca vitripennis]|nr:hypothetical protein J6590_070010 [Homalodisca vitripennis]